MAIAGTPAVIQAEDIQGLPTVLHHTVAAVSHQDLIHHTVLLLKEGIHHLQVQDVVPFQLVEKTGIRNIMTAVQAPINIPIAE